MQYPQAADDTPPSGAVDRTLMHTRQVQYRCYERADGLWDLEGELVDTKTHPVGLYERGQVPPGEPIHHMLVRLVLDDGFTVRAVETRMIHQPLHECGQAVAPMQRMVGATMARGWRQSIEAALGNVQGCAHLRELLQNMATAAFQSIPSALAYRRGDGSKPDAPGEGPPFQLGRCITWDVDGPAVARHYPDYAGWEPLRRMPRSGSSSGGSSGS